MVDVNAKASLAFAPVLRISGQFSGSCRVWSGNNCGDVRVPTVAAGYPCSWKLRYFMLSPPTRRQLARSPIEASARNSPSLVWIEATRIVVIPDPTSSCHGGSPVFPDSFDATYASLGTPVLIWQVTIQA